MSARRRRRSVLFAAVAGTATLSVTMALLGGTPAAADPPSAPAAPDLPAKQSVVVLLKDQLGQRPAVQGKMAARQSAAESAQRSVLARVSAKSAGGLTAVKHYSLVNAFSASATAAQVAALRTDPAVSLVAPDVKVTLPARPDKGVATGSGTKARAAEASGPICPADPAKPLLEPEALTDTRTASDDPTAKTAQQLADGHGVRVGYIADGINPDSPDFIRANGDHVIVDYKAFGADGPDPSEGGVEAYGDASAIAAQGLVPHDLSTFVNPAYPLPAGCNIRILGMAPAASIVTLKIDFYTSSIIQAIDYAVSKGDVDVLNESFGLNAVPDTSARAAISQFNDMAVDAGVTVTVSSGDAGTTGTIGTPATDPKVIAVAANTNSRLYAQTGYAGARAFSNGHWVNDQISSLSSGGVTQRGSVVDLTAPGEAGWAVCDAGSAECTNFRGSTSDINPFGGTSQSAPLTAGAAALVIQAYRSTHGDATPSPKLVKRLLTSTATDLGFPAYEQGAGLLNSRAAVEAALTYPGGKDVTASGVGSNITLSKSSLEISGKPGSRHTRTVAVRNVGAKRVHVKVSTRDYRTIASSTKTTALSAQTDPTFPYPTTGAPWAFKKFTFKVPAGTDRLSAAMIWQGAARKVGATTVTPVVRLTVLQPDGAFVSNSRPQGGAVSANYANLDVRKPVAGTWTAVIYTLGSASGYTGDVSLRTTAERAVTSGSVSRPSFALRSGQSKNVKVRVHLPADSGDSTQAVTVASSGGHRTAIAVTKRAVVPIRSGVGRLKGSITGGNGRGGAPAQTLSYAFHVPHGTKDVSVGVRLASDPGIQLEGVLVDPHGESASVGTNTYTDAQGNVADQGLAMQLSTAAPVPGDWQLVIVVPGPVTGKAFSESFSGTIRFDRSRVKASGVPTSTATKLAQGETATATVSVRNTGIAPINVQLDPRTAAASEIALLSPFADAAFKLPPAAQYPVLVPPGTTGLTAIASATVPVITELTPAAQGIDVTGSLAPAGTSDTVSVARVSEPTGTVSTGIWYVLADSAGITGEEGAPAGTGRFDVLAHTPALDPAVESSTGDFWAAAFDPNAHIGTPAVVQPGASAKIKVSITPTGRVGSKVRGVLYVVTPPGLNFPAFATTGDVLTAIPYAYTVGASKVSPVVTKAAPR